MYLFTTVSRGKFFIFPQKPCAVHLSFVNKNSWVSNVQGTFWIVNGSTFSGLIRKFKKNE